MKKIWINRANSFDEARDFDNTYYSSLSSTERVENVQILREEYFKIHGLKFREDGKRLRRVFRIIKQAWCPLLYYRGFCFSVSCATALQKDMDIWADPAADNAKKLLTALDEFGFGSLNPAVEDFSTPGNIIQLGCEPVRIDIITSIKGLEFAGIWESRIRGSYGKQTVNFIDRQNLIRSKKLSNRAQDKADLELLLSEE